MVTFQEGIKELDLKLEGRLLQISVKLNFLVMDFLAFQDSERSSDAYSHTLPSEKQKSKQTNKTQKTTKLKQGCGD